MPMTQNYDTGVDISNQRGAMQREMGNQNPLMDALKTIQLYVTSQREKGNEAPAAAFVSFLDSLRGGGGEQAQQRQAVAGQSFNPFEAPEDAQSAQRRPEMVMPAGQRSEMSGKAKVMGM